MLFTSDILVNIINILRALFSYESAFLPKSFCQSQNVTKEKLREAILYNKHVRKMMMKLAHNRNGIKMAYEHYITSF